MTDEQRNLQRIQKIRQNSNQREGTMGRKSYTTKNESSWLKGLFQWALWPFLWVIVSLTYYEYARVNNQNSLVVIGVNNFRSYLQQVAKTSELEQFHQEFKKVKFDFRYWERLYSRYAEHSEELQISEASTMLQDTELMDRSIFALINNMPMQELDNLKAEQENLESWSSQCMQALESLKRIKSQSSESGDQESERDPPKLPQDNIPIPDPGSDTETNETEEKNEKPRSVTLHGVEYFILVSDTGGLYASLDQDLKIQDDLPIFFELQVNSLPRPVLIVENETYTLDFKIKVDGNSIRAIDSRVDQEWFLVFNEQGLFQSIFFQLSEKKFEYKDPEAVYCRIKPNDTGGYIIAVKTKQNQKDFLILEIAQSQIFTLEHD